MNRRDEKWERILIHAPRELLVALAKKQPGHRPSEFSKDSEALLDEVFRVCDRKTIETLYEEFPGPQNFSTWFYKPRATLTKTEVEQAAKKHLVANVSDGVKIQASSELQIYKYEASSSNVVLRYVAADRNQRLSVEFGETQIFRVVSYYDCLFHFSDVVAFVFGPSGSHKSEQIMSAADSRLDLKGSWELLRPKRGESREFYNKIKKSIKGLLIETKRDDPGGDYKTITLESKHKRPDLEQVANFQKYYLHADSYYDVLEYSCKDGFGLLETTNVRFGRPFGRFTFKNGTSLTAISYFQDEISALLR